MSLLLPKSASMKAFHSQVRDEPSLSSDEGASFVGSGQEEIVNYEGSVTSTPTDGSPRSEERRVGKEC